MKTENTPMPTQHEKKEPWISPTLTKLSLEETKNSFQQDDQPTLS